MLYYSIHVSGAAQAAESVVQVRHFNALTPWGHSQATLDQFTINDTVYYILG